MKTENGKTTYSPKCDSPGCIDYNLTISEGIATYNAENGTKFDAMRPRDVACFHLGDGIMGKVTAISCGCEIRGGGNLIAPLHLHYCETHSAQPEQPTELEGMAPGALAELARVHRTIDLTPASMKTPEGAAKVAAALDEWNGSAHAAANAAAHYFEMFGMVTDQDYREECDELRDLLKTRAAKQEAFLRAVGGK